MASAGQATHWLAAGRSSAVARVTPLDSMPCACSATLLRIQPSTPATHRFALLLLGLGIATRVSNRTGAGVGALEARVETGAGVQGGRTGTGTGTQVGAGVHRGGTGTKIGIGISATETVTDPGPNLRPHNCVCSASATMALALCKHQPLSNHSIRRPGPGQVA